MDTRVLKTLAKRRQATAQARAMKRRPVAVPLAVPKEMTPTPRTASFPTANLVSYWSFDSDWQDLVGTNHLTNVNGVTAVAGKLGQAGDFENSSSQYLSHTDPNPLGNEDWTYALWFKRETLTTVRILVGKDHAVTRAWVIDNGNSQARLSLLVSAKIVAVPVVNDTAWHFVVAWHDAAADTINIQADNGTPASTATTGSFGTSAREVRIGAREYAGFEDYWDGLIDEVALWRRVLTAQERSDLYNGGDGLPLSGTHAEDVILTDDDRDLFTPHVIQIEGELMPFRVRVDPYYYFEHVTEDSSGVWIYAPTR